MIMALPLDLACLKSLVCCRQRSVWQHNALRIFQLKIESTMVLLKNILMWSPLGVKSCYCHCHCHTSAVIFQISEINESQTTTTREREVVPSFFPPFKQCCWIFSIPFDLSVHAIVGWEAWIIWWVGVIIYNQTTWSEFSDLWLSCWLGDCDNWRWRWR